MKRFHIAVDSHEVQVFAAGLEDLTRREGEVVQGILYGWSARQMAAEFGISHRTVEVHRARAFYKLGVGGLVDFFRLSAHAFMREAAKDALIADRRIVSKHLANIGCALAA